MSDDLERLKAALHHTPASDAEAKAKALHLALENFDRLQGSRDAARLDQDRPARAGFLNGVVAMLKNLSSRPALAATTSVAALCLGLLVALPTLRQSWTDLPPLPGDQPAPLQDKAEEATKPALPEPEAKDDALATTLPAPAEPAAEASMAQDAAPPAPPPLAKRSLGLAADGAQAMGGSLAAPPAASRPLTLDNGQIVVLQDAPILAPEPDTEAFANAAPNPVRVTAEEPVSTFSAEVDTASWAVIRQGLNAGQLPPAEAVRIEEMVNYFPYDYPAPKAGEAPFAPSVAVMQTPWNPGTRLVRIALQGRMPEVADRPALNLVFLIDTSGSMEDATKLPLLKQSLGLMLGRLSPQDQVAIVAYAGSAGEVLPPTPASDRAAILAALDNLAAGGSTAGAEGIALAYQVAEGMQRDGAVSRVLLATDGDFNVGIDDPEALKRFIADQRDSGTYLSVLGFGRGNLDDATMQALAQNGNGTASYIDTLSEAQKVLGDQLTGALFPIADDVKIQVEWNPAEVAEYRLIGYETRALRREDFNNDRVDAGEIGAGLQVTALYEITPPGSPALLNDALRYGAAPEAGGSAELGFLRLRYKDPGQAASQLIETPITGAEPADAEARFAAAIAGMGQLLQGSVYLNGWGWDQAIALASEAKGADPYGYRAEAITLMRLAQSLSR